MAYFSAIFGRYTHNRYIMQERRNTIKECIQIYSNQGSLVTVIPKKWIPLGDWSLNEVTFPNFDLICKNPCYQFCSSHQRLGISGLSVLSSVCLSHCSSRRRSVCLWEFFGLVATLPCQMYYNFFFRCVHNKTLCINWRERDLLFLCNITISI